MSFHFALETLLRYRRNAEEREWLRLQSTAQQLAFVRNELQAAEQIRREVRSGVADQMTAGMRSAEVQFMREYELALEAACEPIRRKLVEIEQEYERRRASFTAERQKREILEKLRESEHERYCRERERREQIQADELFLMRRATHRD